MLVESWAGMADIIELDCSEFPCIVLAQMVNGDTHCCPQLSDSLPESFKATGAKMISSKSISRGGGEGMYVITSFIDSPSWTDDVSLRTEWRQDQLEEKLDQE